MTAVTRFVARSRVPLPPARVFAWHARPGAFSRLQPAWEGSRVIARQGTVADGDRAVLSVPLGPLRVEWEAEHFDLRPPTEGGPGHFRDRQVRGPFAHWEQCHRFLPDGMGGTIVEDEVEYRLPGGAPGRWLGGASARKTLAALFAHRHAALARELRRHDELDRLRGAEASAGARPLRVAIAGASGLIGHALAAFLSTGGHEVLRLERPGTRPRPDAVGRAVAWDPARRDLDAAALGELDAVVNLAGASVADGRWTPARKQVLRDSRVAVTAFLAHALARLPRPPAVLVSASAIGFYGPRDGDGPDATVDEQAPAGSGFLAELARDWEAAAAPAAAAGVRVVHPRIGLVLTPAGGLLERVLPVFRAGLGGRLGSGRQVMSWITLDDAVYALARALLDGGLVGPFNLTAPAPVPNAEFTRTLAAVLGRPAVLPVPGAALKAALGEFAIEALSGVRALPARLGAAGHRFEFPELNDALRWLLGRNPVPRPSQRDGRIELDLAA